jgi:hypothetical protein
MPRFAGGFEQNRPDFAANRPIALVPEAQNPMATTEEVNSFLDKVDSIQSRFLESLITGQRDAIFRETPVNPLAESDDDRIKAHIDSQRGTF